MDEMDWTARLLDSFRDANLPAVPDGIKVSPLGATGRQDAKAIPDGELDPLQHYSDTGFFSAIESNQAGYITHGAHGRELVFTVRLKVKSFWPALRIANRKLTKSLSVTSLLCRYCSTFPGLPQPALVLSARQTHRSQVRWAECWYELPIAIRSHSGLSRTCQPGTHARSLMPAASVRPSFTMEAPASVRTEQDDSQWHSLFI
jgi:hypothetical protein